MKYYIETEIAEQHLNKAIIASSVVAAFGLLQPAVSILLLPETARQLTLYRKHTNRAHNLLNDLTATILDLAQGTSGSVAAQNPSKTE